MHIAFQNSMLKGDVTRPSHNHIMQYSCRDNVLNIYQHFYSWHNLNICFIISQEQEMLQLQKDNIYYKEECVLYLYIFNMLPKYKR
jgi:hypothetical protein